MSWFSVVDNFEFEDCDVRVFDTVVGDSLKLVCDGSGS